MTQRSFASKNTPSSSEEDISKKIENYIKSSELKSLKDYQIRKLVLDAEAFGGELRQQRLETNQIRKFLDAINQLKAQLVEAKADGGGFAAIETGVVLLKPKLAYAGARQDVVKPLNRVLSAAIDKTLDEEDFDRLVQLVESIIAYHKEAGGK
jgi:CRISPR-associated protein Csm2